MTLLFPSQAMEVDVTVVASKLARIIVVTPSFKGVFALVVVVDVSVIGNKQDNQHDNQNDTKNEYRNLALVGTTINISLL